MKTIAEIRTAIAAEKNRSAWNKGVALYALDLLSDLADNAVMYGTIAEKKALLNGASDWTQYSYGGCSLIYDGDIAERLCSPSELERCKHGDRNPNSREMWFDVQARALFQAANRIARLARAN